MLPLKEDQSQLKKKRCWKYNKLKKKYYLGKQKINIHATFQETYYPKWNTPTLIWKIKLHDHEVAKLHDCECLCCVPSIGNIHNCQLVLGLNHITKHQNPNTTERESKKELWDFTVLLKWAIFFKLSYWK